jgi:hypothetical protein
MIVIDPNMVNTVNAPPCEISSSSSVSTFAVKTAGGSTVSTGSSGSSSAGSSTS